MTLSVIQCTKCVVSKETARIAQMEYIEIRLIGWPRNLPLTFKTIISRTAGPMVASLYVTKWPMQTELPTSHIIAKVVVLLET